MNWIKFLILIFAALRGVCSGSDRSLQSISVDGNLANLQFGSMITIQVVDVQIEALHYIVPVVNILLWCNILDFLLFLTDFIVAYEEKTELRADYAEERKKSLARKKYLMGLLRAGLEMERVILQQVSPRFSIWWCLRKKSTFTSATTDFQLKQSSLSIEGEQIRMQAN